MSHNVRKKLLIFCVETVGTLAKFFVEMVGFRLYFRERYI